MITFDEVLVILEHSTNYYLFWFLFSRVTVYKYVQSYSLFELSYERSVVVIVVGN